VVEVSGIGQKATFPSRAILGTPRRVLQVKEFEKSALGGKSDVEKRIGPGLFGIYL
jgi:hypothetical protein